MNIVIVEIKMVSVDGQQLEVLYKINPSFVVELGMALKYAKMFQF